MPPPWHHYAKLKRRLKRHKCRLDESLPTKWNGCAPSTSSRYLCFRQICSLPLNITHSNKSLKPQIVEVSELRGKHVPERCRLRHLSHFPLRCEVGRAVWARKRAQQRPRRLNIYVHLRDLELAFTTVIALDGEKMRVLSLDHQMRPRR
jgi:hypothetical protein